MPLGKTERTLAAKSLVAPEALRAFEDRGIDHALIAEGRKVPVCACCGQTYLMKTCPGERLTERELNLLERVFHAKWYRITVDFAEYNQTVERIRQFEAQIQERDETTHFTFNPVQCESWDTESQTEYPQICQKPIILLFKGRYHDAFCEPGEWIERSPVTLKLSLEGTVYMKEQLDRAIHEIECARQSLSSGSNILTQVGYKAWELKDGGACLNEFPIMLYWTNDDEDYTYSTVPLTLGDARRVSQKMAEAITEVRRALAIETQILADAVREHIREKRERMEIKDSPSEGEGRRIRP